MIATLPSLALSSLTLTASAATEAVSQAAGHATTQVATAAAGAPVDPVSHWIIAPVLLPAVLAPLMVLLMRFDLLLQRVFSLAGAVALAGLAAWLMADASTGHIVDYRLGNWPAPFGIILVLDRLSALMLTLTAGLSVPVLLYAIGSNWDTRGRHFHALFQFQLMGINGAFLTGDAFNLFVFFEVLLIASYGLMIHGGGAERMKAGVQYVVFNLAGSTLFLFALGTIYSVTGTLNMADLAEKVAHLPAGDAGLIRVGAMLLILVFAVKGALVPLQFWLPNTYSHAPGPVAALFAVMTKIGAYAILRVYTLIFPPTTPATGTMFADILLPAALVTLAIGMIGIMGAKQMARMVSFAAIGSMGTLFIAIAQFTPAGNAAALYYTVHSTLAAAALFLITDLTIARRGEFGGALRAAPKITQSGLIAALFFVAAIATAGMPPLSGFLGKLLVMQATWNAPLRWWIWGAILVTSLISIVGFARAGSSLYWKANAIAPGGRLSVPEERPLLPFVATGMLLAGLVALTVFAGPVTHWMQGTATQLLDRTAYITAVLGHR
ncbi:monovalent cation/H+ antiporter subunit D [Acidimangrovimonas sediminis]|uniref:monovalent cation/H+ antiporter subunit D n=1 Tax=Acidimangrovimonas sediminis TaxID=2056283 RepID=UPI0018EC4215|nr:monovalent cation/H+ antiporter subunit D [Acidimangrovimonas sediminis]